MEVENGLGASKSRDKGLSQCHEYIEITRCGQRSRRADYRWRIHVIHTYKVIVEP